MKQMVIRPRLSFEIIVRIIADILMVNIAFIIALSLRYFWLIGIEEGVALSSRTLLITYAQNYFQSFWLLTLISISIFTISGFYSHSRLYKSRYKALIIAQAVSLSYLTFGFCGFLFSTLVPIPRSVLFVGWVLTILLLAAARLWSTLWKQVAHMEQRLYGEQPPAEKIKNVLVIGGAGYIGSALLQRLLNKGYRVRLLDLLLFGTEPIAKVIDHPNLEIVEADFRQVDKVVEAMRGIDAVIHLGAIVGDPACALDEDLTIEINVTATRMIAEIAKGNRVNRFIFASTCSVYGAADEMLDEHSRLNPVSLYARSKIASERVLRQMADDRFAPVIMRFGTIYGFSGRTRFDLVINLLVAKALIDSQITVFGGDQWRPFVHVSDAALAVFKALEAPLPLVRNQVFNVGSNEQNYTIQQVGELIHQRVPTAELLCSGTDGDRRDYRVNFSKIRNMLDFKPEWNVEQGVEQVIQAIQSGEVTNYTSAMYSNVKFLKEEGTSRLVRQNAQWAHVLIRESSWQEQEQAQETADLQHGHEEQPPRTQAVGASS